MRFDDLDRLYPLAPEDLPRQWALSEDEGALPQGWARRSGGGWHLAAHPDARICDLRDSGGAWLGWAVEVMVALRAGAPVGVGGSITLDVDMRSGAGAEAVERALYGRSAGGGSADGAEGPGTVLEGPWTAILPGLGRIYLAAAHSVVYAPQQRMVATSHNLIPGLARDQTLSAAYDPLGRGGHYAFGLTAFAGLRRLLPNHWLDLGRLEAHRHWPRGRLAPLEDGAAGAAAIVEHGRQLIAALAAEADELRIPLSAGQDSRAILAMTRPIVAGRPDLVTLATTVGEDVVSRVDGQAAARLAAIAGLELTVTRRGRHRPDEALAQRMFVRIGEAFGGPILSAPKLREAPEEGAAAWRRFNLPGMGGELGRGFLWERSALRAGRPPAALVAARVGSPLIVPVLEAAEAWLAGLPDDLRESTPDALDLAYLEQRTGCWQAPSAYLFPGPARSLNLMQAGRSMETMLRLPATYRLRGRLQRDMVAHGWPELLEVPFNRATGALVGPAVMAKVRGLPRRALGRLRMARLGSR